MMDTEDDIHVPSDIIHVPSTPPVPAPPAAPPCYAALFSGSGSIAAAQLFVKEVTNHSIIVSGQRLVTCDEEQVPVKHLRRLTMASLHLSTIDSFMGQLNMLTHVNLSFNKIVDVSPLALLSRLEVVDISHNKVVSLEALRDSVGIHTLRCQHNLIESLEPLMKLEQIRELWINDNNIPWGEFIFLLPLVQLRSVVMLNNPGSRKAKILDFVKALRPTLYNIDGIDVLAEMAKESFHGDRGLAQIAYVQEGHEFQRSTDGRVMLAQAQAQLSRHHRETLQKSAGAMQRIRALEQESGGRSYNNVPAGLEPTSKAVIHDGVYNRGRLRKQYKQPQQSLVNSGVILDGHDNQVSQCSIASNVTDEPSVHSVKSSGYGQQRKIRKFKAKHGTQAIAPKRPADMIGSAENFSNLQYGAKERAPTEKSELDEPKSYIASTEEDSIFEEASAPIQQLNLSPLRRSGQLDPMKVLRFGDNSGDAGSIHQTEESMVAICLYPNQDGYARWKKGPVAVSFERKRLFSSYKDGSIAAMCDADGNGSVMDTQGRNVLLLTSQKKNKDNIACAKVLNPKSGRLLAEYRKDDSIDAGLQGYRGGTGNDVTIGGQIGGGDDVLESPTKINQYPGKGHGAKIHTWKFAGFVIEFEPSIWDLRVKFGNERMVCEFSSVHGGQILKEKGPESDTEESVYRSKKPSPLKAYNNQKAPLKSRLGASDHVRVRKDVDAIMKSLDNVLAELDTKLPNQKDIKLPMIKMIKGGGKIK